MTKKTISYMIIFLIFISCLTSVSIQATATSSSFSDSSDVIWSTNKADENRKSKGFNVFSKENHKYLSYDQKKVLLELKKCKEKGDTFSEDQQKTLNSITDCIIKGKLGDKDYEDFKSLMERKNSNKNLSEDESKRLNDYNAILDGTKHTTEEILDQFLR
ncbi:hypothetical protein [Clostridium saccharoperbutylacetonicum]